MLSTAHIFYIPVSVVAGIFIGYYIGRYHVEVAKRDAARKNKRKQKITGQNES